MRVTLVVHGVDPHPAGGVEVVMRPVVNEPETNRDWSPGAVPTGELKLRVTPKIAESLKPGARLVLALDAEDPKAAKAARPAKREG